MSAYGDMLGVFPELFDTYPLYSAEAQIGGGYALKEMGSISLIVQNASSSLNVADQYSRSAGSSGSAAGIVSMLAHHVAFGYDCVDLYHNFVKIGNDYFRTMVAEDWVHEGDFYRYDLHKIVGGLNITETHKLSSGSYF